MCRFVGTVPDILGLVLPIFRPKSGSKSKISGRILKSFRGPVVSAELGDAVFAERGSGDFREIKLGGNRFGALQPGLRDGTTSDILVPS